MPGMVRDCLADDFSSLLDPAQLETIPEAERRGPDIWRGRHRLYRERHGLECVFNHHDPAANAADYAFFGAGVRRLRTALGHGRHRQSALDDDPSAHADRARRRDRRPARPAGEPQPPHLSSSSRSGRAAVRVVEVADLRPDLRWLSVETPSAPVGLRLADLDDDAAPRLGDSGGIRTGAHALHVIHSARQIPGSCCSRAIAVTEAQA